MFTVVFCCNGQGILLTTVMGYMGAVQDLCLSVYMRSGGWVILTGRIDWAYWRVACISLAGPQYLTPNNFL